MATRRENTAAATDRRIRFDPVRVSASRSQFTASFVAQRRPSSGHAAPQGETRERPRLPKHGPTKRPTSPHDSECRRPGDSPSPAAQESGRKRWTNVRGATVTQLGGKELGRTALSAPSPTFSECSGRLRRAAIHLTCIVEPSPIGVSPLAEGTVDLTAAAMRRENDDSPPVFGARAACLNRPADFLT